MPKKPPASHLIESDTRIAELLNIAYHPGYEDPFTRDQCPIAAIPNQARVEKVSRKGDTDLHDPGALGTVLGSIGHPAIGVAYFVEFDDMPKRAIMIHENGIRPHEAKHG